MQLSCRSNLQIPFLKHPPPLCHVRWREGDGNWVIRAATLCCTITGRQGTNVIITCSLVSATQLQTNGAPPVQRLNGVRAHSKQRYIFINTTRVSASPTVSSWRSQNEHVLNSRQPVGSWECIVISHEHECAQTRELYLRDTQLPQFRVGAAAGLDGGRKYVIWFKRFQVFVFLK